MKLGVPLNRFITINWSTAGVEDGFGATQAFMKRTGDWLRARKVPLAYVRVREGVGGDHVHILMHIPTALVRSFWPQQGRWLRELGAGLKSGSVRTRPVGFSYSDYEASPSSYLNNLSAVVTYLLKLKEPTAGVVRGLRVSVSASLNRHARMRHRYSQYRLSPRLKGP